RVPEPAAQVELLDAEGVASQQEVAKRRELVIIDAGVADSDQLVEDLRASAALGAGIEVVQLDAERDGVTQIAEILAGYDDLDAVHIVSHGSDGAVQLGSGWLTAETLDAHASTVAGWGDALSLDGDLLFYGCDLAASDEGQALVATLADLTGADVAASTDDTGHALLGGDWDLEHEAGQIETGVAFSATAQQQWSNLLALVNLTAHEVQSTEYEIKSDQNAGQTFSYTSGSGSYTLENLEVQLRAESDASAQNITVSLRASWGGADIASAQIASSSLSTTQTWETFALGGVTLNDGQTYTIRITSDSTDGKVYAGYDNASGYANGDFIDKDGNPQSGQDLAFRAIGIVPVITARETVDSDGDGEIDQVRITTDENLNDNFGDLNISVAGYAVTGYSTDIANDNIFYVDLTQSGTPDTDATPNIAVVENTLLTEDGGPDALVADQGRIVFERNSNIYTADPDGSNETLVLDDPGSRDNYGPLFSPDGSKIFFHSDRDGTNNEYDIWSMDADGSNLAQLTNNGPDDERAPRVSPDGTKVLYQRDAAGNTDNEIWIMDADGSNETLLIDSAGEDLYASWSPDGSQIVFASTRDGGNYNIYVADADGGNQTRLTNSTDLEERPSWSPDGTQILYERVVGGDRRIYVMDADGGNQTPIVNSSGEDLYTKWSPDGSRIIFQTTRHGATEIYT
ncbi:MAG: DUF4347 domain-containing protein, partial [Candidatus Binatia bacterium]